MLSSFDDHPIHQGSVPIAFTATSDPNHYDRYFFNGYTKDESLYFAVAMGLYPNRHVADASFSVVHRGEQISLHASRRAPLDRAEATLAPDLDKPLGKLIYPPSPFTPEQEAANRDALRRTEVAQASIGATSLGMYRLLSALGVEADCFAGHSYGEYAALAAAGALSEHDLSKLSFKRGTAIREAAAAAPGGMIAADGSADAIAPLLAQRGGTVTFLGGFGRVNSEHSGIYLLERASSWPVPVRILPGPEVINLVVCGDPHRNRVMVLWGGYVNPVTKKMTFPQ